MYNDERRSKFYHNSNSSSNSNIGDSDRLQVLLIGNVIDAVSSFAVSRPKHICILDEVVTSSREYRKGEASGWDDFLENGRSDIWDSMEAQSKASLQYMSKKRIPRKKINQMKYKRLNMGLNFINQEGCFNGLRLEKVIEVNVRFTGITNADMADLGRACPNLQTLNISHCSNITNVGLIELSRYCHGLKDINMACCRFITNTGLIDFSKNCRGLHRIDLMFCDDIVAGGVEVLSQHCRDLQFIKIGGGSRIKSGPYNDADLLALSINCQQLQEIYLCTCDEVTDDGLIEMSKHLSSNKQFRNITIWGGNLISNRGVIGFSRNYPYLKSITISGRSFTDDCMVSVTENCTGLESIDISGNDWVTDISMNAIAKNCHGLKDINISSCTNITEAGRKAVAEGISDS